MVTLLQKLYWGCDMNIYRTIDSENLSREQERHRQAMFDKDQESLEFLLSDPSGRWFLMRLFDKCKLFSDTFTGNSRSFYLEGMRNVALMYLQEISQLGLKGIEAKQLAEREYIKAQKDFIQIIKKEDDAYE